MGSCTAATADLATRPTVADAARKRPEPFKEIDAKDLALFAHKLAIEYGAGPGTKFNPWTTRKWLDAFTIVIDACRRSGWPPKVYVRAQLNAMSLNLAKGWGVHPGTFFGAAADERFSKWVTRMRRSFGESPVSRLTPERRATESREAAARRCGILFYADNQPLHEAEADAQRTCPTWSVDTSTDYEKIIALESGLATLHVSFPHRVLLPSGPWTWLTAHEAVTALVGTPTRQTASDITLPAELGEFA